MMWFVFRVCKYLFLLLMWLVMVVILKLRDFSSCIVMEFMLFVVLVISMWFLCVLWVSSWLMQMVVVQLVVLMVVVLVVVKCFGIGSVVWVLICCCVVQLLWWNLLSLLLNVVISVFIGSCGLEDLVMVFMMLMFGINGLMCMMFLLLFRVMVFLQFNEEWEMLISMLFLVRRGFF